MLSCGRAWDWLPGVVHHHFSTVEFEEGGEVCPLSAFVQWGPLQLVVHFTDTVERKQRRTEDETVMFISS